MKAARLHAFNTPLKIDEIPVPVPGTGEVLVRIAGAGVCHSDFHIMGHEMQRPLPFTLGHENAGYVEEVGSGVSNVKKGDPVAVYGCWGCGTCRFCRLGEEQLCTAGNFGGITTDGGYAEYLLVPHSRHLVLLDGLDPVDAAPLTDAGLTPYRAIKKALPHLYPGASAVLIGLGGLGHLAVQILRALSPATRIIGVDVSEEKLQAALNSGMHHAVDGRGDAVSEIKRLTGGEGAQAVFDLVGTDATLKTAAASFARKGIVVVVGVGGGTLSYSSSWLADEVIVTSTLWGSCSELQEVLALAAAGMIKPHVQRYPLEAINDVFDLMKAGRLSGRAVITP
jgi:propanol-preferring alcohol dehydrogenase